MELGSLAEWAGATVAAFGLFFGGGATLYSTLRIKKERQEKDKTYLPRLQPRFGGLAEEANLPVPDGYYSSDNKYWGVLLDFPQTEQLTFSNYVLKFWSQKPDKTICHYEIVIPVVVPGRYFIYRYSTTRIGKNTTSSIENPLTAAGPYQIKTEMMQLPPNHWAVEGFTSVECTSSTGYKWKWTPETGWKVP